MIRRPLLGLALLLVASVAMGADSPVLRPPTSVRFLPDDTPYTWGNTAAAPDVSVEWDTVSAAEPSLQCTVPSGAGLLVSSDASVDRSGVLAAGATYLGVCSDDAAAPTECLTTRHDGTDGIIASHSGDIEVWPASDRTDVFATTVNGGILSLNATTAGYVEQVFSETTNIAAEFDSHFGFDQFGFLLSNRVGYQVILGSTGARLQDYDHPVTTTPTLYWQDATLPDANNTIWANATQDGTDLRFDSGAGTGAFRFDGTTDLVSVGPAGNDVDVASSGAGIAFSGTARPTHTISFGAREFEEGANAGATAVAVSSNKAVWCLDGAGVANESIRASWVLPYDYADATNVSVAVWWFRTGAGAPGALVWRIDFLSSIEGGASNAALTPGTVTAGVAGVGQNVLSVVTASDHANMIITGATLATGELLEFEVVRVPGDENDTAAYDACVHRVELTYTVDRE